MVHTGNFIASSFFLNLTQKNAKKQLFLGTFEVFLRTFEVFFGILLR
jgi:hypothetical protein